MSIKHLKQMKAENKLLNYSSFSSTLLNFLFTLFILTPLLILLIPFVLLSIILSKLSNLLNKKSNNNNKNEIITNKNEIITKNNERKYDLVSFKKFLEISLSFLILIFFDLGFIWFNRFYWTTCFIISC